MCFFCFSNAYSGSKGEQISFWLQGLSVALTVRLHGLHSAAAAASPSGMKQLKGLRENLWLQWLSDVLGRFLSLWFSGTGFVTGDVIEYVPKVTKVKHFATSGQDPENVRLNPELSRSSDQHEEREKMEKM